MFDIGWSELLVIAVVAIVVVGPKDLPRLMRTFGHYAGKLRRAAADFQRQFEDAIRETEMEEVKKAIESVRDQTPNIDLKAPVDKPIMLPNPSAPAQTNGKSAATEAPPTEPAGQKAAPKRKRAAKPKAATPELAASGAAAKPAAPKPRRSRKPKVETQKAEPQKAEAQMAEPKPSDAEPKP
ncbi:MAG TPA: Sec-independent protein translocase protein TatB [Methyloceanibacter sp.]|nr:Sec-independent protein translocase protein TatB [Methyloceanibacter sp.]